MASNRIRILGSLAILAILATAFVTLDFAAGRIGETGIIREESRKFREEAAYFRTTTLNLAPSIRHEFLPGDRDAAGTLSRHAPRMFRTDDLGYIKSNNDSDAATKILFLGGSTTESNEVDEAFRFPAVVGSALNSAGVRVRTLNAGVRGHTTQDNINALLNRPGLLDASVAVLMENINDRLRLAIQGNYTGRLGTDPPVSSAAVFASARGLMHSSWDYVSYRSNILFLARNAVARFNAWTGETVGVSVGESNINFPDPNFDEHRLLFERNLRIFVSIARAYDMQPALMTQPLGVASEPQAVFNESIRRVAAETKSVLIDLDAALPAPKSWAFLKDNIHFNNRGSTAIGHIVAEHLAPLLGATLQTKAIETGILSPPDMASRCKLAATEVASAPVRQLLAESGRYPSLSPDNGRWLLFQTWKGGRDRIRAYDSVRREVIDLSPEVVTASERHPAFLSSSSDTFEIVFGQGFDKQNPRSIERLMARQWPSFATREMLFGDKGISGSIPAVSGEEIVFAGANTSSRQPPDLYRLHSTTQRLAKMTDTPWEEWRPAIAPDKSVYFISNKNGNFDIFRLAHGSELPDLFYGSPADEWDPAVSPDGNWIAFASKAKGNWDVYVTRTEQPSSIVQITTSLDDEWDPAWHPKVPLLLFAASSPDGPRIMGTCLFGEEH